MAKLYAIDDFLCRGTRRGKTVDKKRYLNSKEVADLLGLSVRTVCTLAERHQDSGGAEGVPAYRFGRRAWSFDRSEIDRWIQSKKTASAKLV